MGRQDGTDRDDGGRRQAAAGKRQRLVDAAWQLVYEQGLARTTLSQVAAEADVPLGNIYYYFPTKSALVDAVLDAHKQHLRRAFAEWERDAPSPLTPLVRYLHAQAAHADKIAERGCHHARLGYDLRHDPDHRPRAGEILQLHLDWAQRLLQAADIESPRNLAVQLVGGVQGAIALATTLQQSEVLVDEVERLERWL